MSDDRLKKLLSLCKCGVSVTVNEHRDYYQTAEMALRELEESENPPKIAEDVRVRMVETNSIIEIQFYPTSPVGFYRVYHYDLDAALESALSCFSPEKP